jgi:hypothetical protein
MVMVDDAESDPSGTPAPTEYEITFAFIGYVSPGGDGIALGSLGVTRIRYCVLDEVTVSVFLSRGIDTVSLVRVEVAP